MRAGTTQPLTNAQRPRARVVFIETTDTSVASHLDGMLAHLNMQFDISVIASDSGRLAAIATRNGVRGIVVPIKRQPSVIEDVRSLLRLIGMLRQEKPDIVLYGTPKAALLGCIAAWLCGVTRRVHVLHGLRAETLAGVPRLLYRQLDRLIERLSTDTVAVGHGLAARAVQIGSMRHKATVLGNGSAQGVDLSRFSARSPIDRDASKFVIGFVGRITADKGIDSLCRAFTIVARAVPHAELHIIGAPEGVLTLSVETREMLETDTAIKQFGEIEDVTSPMRSFDVLCLPTRREGLPTVLMEAAATGVPIVTTSATGVEDIVDESMAWIVPIDDSCALASVILRVHSNPHQAMLMARVARRHIENRFDRRIVWGHWAEYIRRELEA